MLLVASSPPPYLPASVHRIRQLSWSLRKAGWEAEILAPGEEFQNPEWRDPRGLELFPNDVPVHLAQPRRPDWLRMAGVRGMGWRGWVPMARKGSDLLQTGRFQLVYISTTQFNFFCLGSFWKKKHRIPYLLDFHDPWYRPHEAIRTTSSRVKAALGNRLAGLFERQAVSSADGLISVSPNYLSELQARYPKAVCFSRKNTAVIPFGFTETDFPDGRMSKNLRNPKKVVYVGVGAELMAKSFLRVLKMWKAVKEKEPELSRGIKIRLYGTDGRWRPGKPKILQKVAEECDCGEWVEENPAILPFSESLALMRQADGLLVLGVEDPAYMPSKLFSYSRSGKPLLACLVKGSQGEGYFRDVPEIGHLISFGKSESGKGAEQPMRDFFEEIQQGREIPRAEVIKKFSDEAMSVRHAVIFEKCMGGAEK